MSKYRIAINSNVASAASGDTVELLPDGNPYPTGAIELTDADGDDIWISADINDIDKVGDFDVYVNGSVLSSQTEADNLFFINKAILDLKDAVNIDYDNAASGLAAANVKAALDELDTDVTAKPDDAADIGLGDVLNIKHNITATSDPSVNDDSGDDYSVGSIWINVSSDKAWICVDATASNAVWQATAAASMLLKDIGLYTQSFDLNNAEDILVNMKSLLNMTDNALRFEGLDDTTYISGINHTLAGALRRLDRAIQDASGVAQSTRWQLYHDFVREPGSTTADATAQVYTLQSTDNQRIALIVPFWMTTDMNYLEMRGEWYVENETSNNSGCNIEIQVSEDFGGIWGVLSDGKVSWEGDSGYVDYENTVDISAISTGVVLMRVVMNTNIAQNMHFRGVQIEATS